LGLLLTFFCKPLADAFPCLLFDSRLFDSTGIRQGIGNRPDWLRVLTLSFATAFGLGIDFARADLTIEGPLSKITIGEKGKGAETEIAANIIRTGERGVLYFDPKSSQFGLVPWDSVKRIDWVRSPLIPPIK